MLSINPTYQYILKIHFENFQGNFFIFSFSQVPERLRILEIPEINDFFQLSSHSKKIIANKAYSRLFQSVYEFEEFLRLIIDIIKEVIQFRSEASGHFNSEEFQHFQSLCESVLNYPPDVFSHMSCSNYFESNVISYESSLKYCFTIRVF